MIVYVLSVFNVKKFYFFQPLEKLFHFFSKKMNRISE